MIFNLSDSESDENSPFPIKMIVAGFSILLLFIGSLVLWVSVAPVEGAVVSPGIIGVSTHRKQIQHLEGGIVKAIHVSDGDEVTEGQLLLELRNIKSYAELRRLQGRRFEVLVIIARLEAEQGGKEKFELPQDFDLFDSDLDTDSVLNRQSMIFNSNRTLIRDQLSVFEKKIDQAREEISGLDGRVDYKQQEIKHLTTELGNVNHAVEKGLIAKDEALKLQQKLALLKGELIGLKSEQGRMQQVLLETRVKKSEKSAQLLVNLSEAIRSHEAELFDLEQQIVKAQDVLNRTRILSPIEGTVVNLQVHSVDGVINPGQSLMEIVPSGDELIVEVFLQPDDIDDVSVGMPADVRFTSVNKRQRIPIQGEVTLISADRLYNSQTGQDYYSARVTLSQTVIEENQMLLIPGMGADVFIRTGSRTPLDYLLSPIVNSLQFALREN
jgi:HlyD family type I secretion membrane fusion protein